MARPKEFEDRTTISVTLEKKEFKSLQLIRRREGLDLTEVGRKAILEYIKGHEEGNSTYPLDRWQTDPNFTAIPTLWASLEIWKNYVRDCSKEEVTKISTKLKQLSREAYYCLNGRYPPR